MTTLFFQLMAGVVLAYSCGTLVPAEIRSPLAPGQRFERFDSNPLDRGWRIFGDTNLFVWNATNMDLDVTWDSARPNSYFRLPLNTILTAEDDFSVSLDLRLDEIASGVDPEKPGAFQIAFGFQNRGNADQASFIRGTGADSPNLVEFNYFPESGIIEPTVWPVMILTNGQVNFAGGDFSLFALPLDQTMRISLNYSASNHTATLTVTTNGALVGPVASGRLVDFEKGFVLDAFAISSYSDVGQQSFPGSIFARGVVDNIEMMTPPPPIIAARGNRGEAEWQHEVLTIEGWNYILEASEDLELWTEVTDWAAGTGDWIELVVPEGFAAGRRFFRVKAERGLIAMTNEH